MQVLMHVPENSGSDGGGGRKRDDGGGGCKGGMGAGGGGGGRRGMGPVLGPVLFAQRVAVPWWP